MNHVGRSIAHAIFVLVRPPPRKEGYCIGDYFYRARPHLASSIPAPSDVISSIHILSILRSPWRWKRWHCLRCCLLSPVVAHALNGTSRHRFYLCLHRCSLVTLSYQIINHETRSDALHNFGRRQEIYLLVSKIIASSLATNELCVLGSALSHQEYSKHNKLSFDCFLLIRYQ